MQVGRGGDCVQSSRPVGYQPEGRPFTKRVVYGSLYAGIGFQAWSQRDDQTRERDRVATRLFLSVT